MIWSNCRDPGVGASEHLKKFSCCICIKAHNGGADKNVNMSQDQFISVVRLVDEGGKAVVGVDQLRYLPEQFRCLPCQVRGFIRNRDHFLQWRFYSKKRYLILTFHTFWCNKKNTP